MTRPYKIPRWLEADAPDDIDLFEDDDQAPPRLTLKEAIEACSRRLANLNVWRRYEMRLLECELIEALAAVEAVDAQEEWDPSRTAGRIMARQGETTILISRFTRNLRDLEIRFDNRVTEFCNDLTDYLDWLEGEE
jgi:hypothetical protein